MKATTFHPALEFTFHHFCLSVSLSFDINLVISLLEQSDHVFAYELYHPSDSSFFHLKVISSDIVSLLSQLHKENYVY